MRPLKRVAVWHNVDRDIFEREIVPLYEPAILKNFANDWNIVQQAKKGQLTNVLKQHYAGGNVRSVHLPAGHNGLFFYDKAFKGFNFERKVESFDNFLRRFCANAENATSDAVSAIQSAPIKDYFPEIFKQLDMPLFDALIEPRFWLGNSSVVAAHNDDAENIAIVVAGRRRFTLFPPEQIGNLYVGPMELTPAGAPVSLVDFSNPDLEKYPKFNQALNHALVAELEPGDAIYIPTVWWHHVEALDGINMLINYWQGGSIAGNKKPVAIDAMLMSMLTIRDLPVGQRQAWKAFFEHYVFSNDDSRFEHLPKEIESIVSGMSEKQQKDIKQWLTNQLKD